MTAFDQREIETTQQAIDALENAQERLRAAGRRAADAEVMRRAAIAEMGAAIRDHGQQAAAFRDQLRPGNSFTKRIPMDHAEEWTGMSRRTLSDAVGNPREMSDRELAAEYRAYGYDEHHGGAELHRRYPRLAGLYEAIMLLWRDQSDREEQELGDDADIFTILGTHEVTAPPGVDVLKREYARRVDAIADGVIPLADRY